MHRPFPQQQQQQSHKQQQQQSRKPQLLIKQLAAVTRTAFLQVVIAIMPSSVTYVHSAIVAKVSTTGAPCAVEMWNGLNVQPQNQVPL
jgi:hypothetical protein